MAAPDPPHTTSRASQMRRSVRHHTFTQVGTPAWTGRIHWFTGCGPRDAADAGDGATTAARPRTAVVAIRKALMRRVIFIRSSSSVQNESRVTGSGFIPKAIRHRIDPGNQFDPRRGARD